jgi:uncharacterized coiled-coil protein SlyX
VEPPPAGSTTAQIRATAEAADNLRHLKGAPTAADDRITRSHIHHQHLTRTNELTPMACDNPEGMTASSESEVIAQELSALGVRIARLEARLAEVDPVIARLEGAALTTARAMQEISKHWDAVYEAMRRNEELGEHSSHGDAHRAPPHEPHASAAENAS